MFQQIPDPKVSRLIENFKNNNINAYYFSNGHEAKNKILSLISKEELVAFGGSTTVKEIGLLRDLVEGPYTVLNRFNDSLTKDEKWEVERQSLLSDIFITGTNAITMDGQLINIDHSGNRVAGILFGPKKVFIVVGVNKIVGSLEDGIERAQHYAAPLNAKRAEKEYSPPCIKGGKCINC